MNGDHSQDGPEPLIEEFVSAIKKLGFADILPTNDILKFQI
jgi:hypothetical protein